MALVLRQNLNRRLTKKELDSNFTYLKIEPWEFRGYEQGEIVFFESESENKIYFCVKTHSSNIYQNNTFQKSLKGIDYWKEIGNTGGSGGSSQPDQLEIGPAEDGTYDDGLYNFTEQTNVGTAVDRFNEILQKLVPPEAPEIQGLKCNSSEKSGYLTFDNNNQISGYANVSGIGGLNGVSVDEEFKVGENRIGIIDGSQNLIFSLNPDVPEAEGNPISPYPANAFGKANSGTLKILLNGSELSDETIDLSQNKSFSSQTGFNVSEPQAVKFTNGETFPSFQYRTGTVNISSSQMRNGHNYLLVEHSVNGVNYITNYIDWIVDSSAIETNYFDESIDSLNLSGSTFLSGIEYFTSGNGTYSLLVNNAYRNVYEKINGIIYSSSECNIADENIPDSNGQETKPISISSKNFNLKNNLILFDENILIQTAVRRTLLANKQTSGATEGNILYHNQSSNSDESSYEDFLGEQYRIPSNLDYSQDITQEYDSEISIKDKSGINYNNGLQVANGSLIYPSKNFNNINFAPSGNRDYSTNVTGTRYYYRYFRENIASAKFTMILKGSGSFIPESTAFTSGSDEIKISIKLPSETGWLDTYRDFDQSYNDGDGCRDLQRGNSGRAFDSKWDLNVGTKNTANSFNKVYIRISVPQDWTGKITEINWTFR